MKISPRFKILITSLACCCILAAGSAVQAAELGVITGNTVNVRKGPSLENAVLTKVKKGESYNVVSKSGQWTKILLANGKEGWVSSSYIKVQSTPNKKYAVITGKVVNVRSGPSTGYKIVTKICLNEKHEILSEKDGWLKIQVGAKQGWILKTLAAVSQGTQNSSPSNIPASPNPPASNPVPDDQAAYITVTGSVVNVRREASIESQVLGTVLRGTRLPVLAKNGDWYQTQLASGTKGWITADYAAAASSELPSRSGGTEVLSAPLATGRLLKILDQAGKPMVVLEGWKQGEFQVSVYKETNTVQLELNGSTPIRYEGSIERVGIQRININGQDEKSIVSIMMPYVPKANVEYDAGVAASYIHISAENGSGLAGRLVVLDPGHSSEQPGGWLDPGAIGPLTKLYEREVNLSISLKLKILLENAGARVMMTHTNSTTLSLAERAALANNNRADIFVSIHANSSSGRSISGHTTYFFAPLDDFLLGSQRASRSRLAALVQKEMVNTAGRSDQGVLENNYIVLRETTVPSILVETAYLSDREEEMLLGQDFFRQQLAEGIFRGIAAYFK